MKPTNVILRESNGTKILQIPIENGTAEFTNRTDAVLKVAIITAHAENGRQLDRFDHVVDIHNGGTISVAPLSDYNVNE